MSSANYYEKRDAKVRIAEELSNMGWKIYGFREDESDSMTDYYSPASWGGIASKNGYVLVIDCRYSGKETEITKRNPNYIQMSNADQTKIESLKNMTTLNGATIGEAENAQKLIERLQAKYQGQECDMYEVIGIQPAHLGNSKGCIWHLEKDGALVDKGNKLTIFADVPDSYRFDIATMQYKDSYKNVWQYNHETSEDEYKERTLSESELKAVNEFKAFILRIERIVNFGNSCGDGTKETEEAFQQQNENEKMIKKTFTKIKKVTKLEEVKRESELQVGDVVYCSSGLCIIKEVRENLYWSVKLGSASRGYQESNKITWTLSRKSFDNGILRGTLKVYNKIEVEEVETVEKWVKVTNKTTTKKETVKTEPSTEENNNNIEFEIVEDIHTKTQEKIYVAKLVERVSKDEFMIILSKIKKLGGYYYKYKGGFIFSEDPTEILKNNFSQSESAEQQEKNIFNDDIESLKNTIIEESGHIIENLNLVKDEYWNNEEYKNKLLQVIKGRNITKSQFKSVIEAIENDIDSKHYIRLIEVLKGFYALENEVKTETQQQEIIINEELAKRSKENMSFNNYKEGSATQEYNRVVENMTQKINEAKEQIKEDNDKQLQLDYLLNKFKKDYANWTNKHNSNGASHVSVMISGASNYNMRKHEKFVAKEGKLWAEYNDIMAIDDKIDKIVYSKKIIKSTDIDALEKLKEKLSEEQKEHDEMIKYNKQARKENKEVYATYMLSNSSQRIKNIKDRISHLEKLEELKETQSNTEIEVNGIKIIDNLEANRVQMIFPDKPNEDIRKILKSNGFRYSYTFGAWQRNRCRLSEDKAKSIAESLNINNIAV